MHDGRPMFSVIIPTHNGEERITPAIVSVACQSFTEWEIIVVLDACDDDTQKAVSNVFLDDLNTLRNKVTFIRVNHHRDGLSRNAGIDAARGKYILFLDDDDFFLHEFVFQQMHDVMTGTDCDCLNYSIVWKNIGYVRQKEGQFVKIVAGRAWKREFIGNTRFSDKAYSSDTEFLEDMVRKKPKVMWWDMPMYYYNYGRKGSLSDRHSRGEI